jgi:hypothetical protein
MAARSYSLETLGQHPTQSLTPPLLRPSGVQRGGSLKIQTPTSSIPCISKQQFTATTSFGISASTSAVTDRPQRVSTMHYGNSLKQPRIPLSERPTSSSNNQRYPTTRLRSEHADLVYAQRVLIDNEPPKEPPPPLPIHRSMAARLTDPQMNSSNSCDF